ELYASAVLDDSNSGCDPCCVSAFHGIMIFSLSLSTFFIPFDPTICHLHSFPTRRSSDLVTISTINPNDIIISGLQHVGPGCPVPDRRTTLPDSSHEGCDSAEYEIVNALLSNSQVTFGDSGTGSWEQIADVIQGPDTLAPA